MINRIQAAADCLAAAKLLYKRHLVNAYEGNVSIRVGDSIFITPTQICKELLTPDDLVEVDIASGAVIRAGKGRRRFYASMPTTPPAGRRARGASLPAS